MRPKTWRRCWLGTAAAFSALLPSALVCTLLVGPAAASPISAVLASGPPAEATRPAGLIGRWVVVALLALVAIAWVTLVAAVVRLHLKLGQEEVPPDGPRPD